ncbi:MAG: flagellar motor protein MotB [Candidatus Binatia bacterium]
MASAKGGKAETAKHGKDDKPRVITKKCRLTHGGGHHGGAWKVAYADFVTAMMALFLVLWLLGASNSKEKAVIAHYFREPGVFSGSRGIIPHGGQDKLGEGIIQAPTMEVLHANIKEGLLQLKQSLNVTDQVPITITADGLLIEMIDKEKQAFFEVNSADVKPIMRKILSLIAKEIKDTPNLLIVAGHTDSRGFHNDSFYSNWELSSARALNTRRDLEELGIASQRFEQVVGYADRKLRRPNDPLAAENRRISILIKNVDKHSASISEEKSTTKAADKARAEKSEAKTTEKTHAEKSTVKPAEKAHDAKAAH